MVKKPLNNVRYFSLFALFGAVWMAARLFNGRFEVPDAKSLVIFLIAAPVCEEMFFRGFIQRVMKNRVKAALYGVSAANVITSVLFALTHVYAWGGVHSALVFVPSLVFGWLMDRTDRLVWPILLHALYNINIFIV